MNPEIIKIIDAFVIHPISEERKDALNPLINYIQDKVNKKDTIRLNFICTHNSRRSHLSQIWAQAMAFHFGIKNIFCYSGGTEATALFPKVAETLNKQGFEIQKLSENENPIYAIKYALNEAPIICFSKKYNNHFNPKNEFAAIMTCDNANQGCPMVLGADARFSITYNDPKAFDNSDIMDEKYKERSIEIGQEMWWVFKSIK